jgi:hypothetical protein
MPKGMPMIVIISKRPMQKYATAISRPPNTTQMMFPRIFIEKTVRISNYFISSNI